MLVVWYVFGYASIPRLLIEPIACVCVLVVVMVPWAELCEIGCDMDASVDVMLMLRGAEV